ncbi:hypothetical protein ACIRPK_32940 [Kitasatospora sp. NPDC101801]|uniref:hypothetical protein n=1 Tax=Kitasatospora sp. NPDC101801 TaxID=3364103 RepID=UPI0038189D0B
MDYRSARDLPSFVAADQQLKAMRAFQWLMPAEKRPDLAALQQKADFLADTVDGFYAMLGPRNWIFHDSMSVDAMAQVLSSASSPEDAEAQLISYYNDPDSLFYLTVGLRRLAAMKPRLELVEKARADYFAGRYYACVHVLLSVMDGFVNEFETVRRGLHARQPEELNAWDSVVGHHMGLKNAHRTFTKGRSATNQEPVYELYRNGIVHGSILNYDNVVVATKAWNRLMAVADWARARQKEQQPPAEKPTLPGLLSRLIENGQINRAVAEFQPADLTAEDEQFTAHLAYEAARDFLAAWRSSNYGAMSRLVTADLQIAQGNAVPRAIRFAYADHRIEDFTIVRLSCSAAVVTTVVVDLVEAGGGARTAHLRWIREDSSGSPRPEPLAGQWRLYTWEPQSQRPLNHSA